MYIMYLAKAEILNLNVLQESAKMPEMLNFSSQSNLLLIKHSKKFVHVIMQDYSNEIRTKSVKYAKLDEHNAISLNMDIILFRYLSREVKH